MNKIILGLSSLIISGPALAKIAFLNAPQQSSVSYECSGSADYNQYKINKLILTQSQISLTYTNMDEQKITQNYVTINFMKKNAGKTDINQPVYIIDGSKSGKDNDYDDISLPHFGLFKAGLSSEIAFETKSGRAFGTVTCIKK